MRYLHCTMIFLIRNSHFDLYYLYSNTILEHFKKYAEINTEKVSLSIGPFLRKLVALFHLHFSASETDASKYKGKYYDSQIRRQQLNRKL